MWNDLPPSRITLEQFQRLDPRNWSRQLFQADPTQLEESGRCLAVDVYESTVASVPAYREFLKCHRFDPVQVIGIGEFTSLPIIDKANYLSMHGLSQLLPNGNLDRSTTIAASSGSTGEPFFWPRGESLDAETAAIHELLCAELLDTAKHRTLALCCFALGTYIAGIITVQALARCQGKGHRISVVTPGLDRVNAQRCLARLADRFEQVLVIAYPTVLKAILEEFRRADGTRLRPRFRFLSAGEAFSEEYRDYIAALAGEADTTTLGANIYGSADAAILGHETPVSIQIRRWAANDRALCRDLFGSERLPSVEAFHPYFKHFESVERRLVLTTFGGIPLVRYAIGDTGGVLRYDEAVGICRDHGYVLSQALQEMGCAHLNWKLPLVFLHGRIDNTVTYIGLNVFPDPIRKLLGEAAWLPYLSGRFKLCVEDGERFDQVFQVHVELAPRAVLAPELVARLAEAIDARLRECNAEYREARRSVAEAKPPVISAWPHEHPKHFPSRIKFRPVETKETVP